MNKQIKRPGLMLYVVVPQIIVLAIFIFSRASVWAAVGMGATSFADFFFELISAGAGWMLMSLGTLMLSLAVHSMHPTPYVEVMESAFTSMNASSFMNELEAEEARLDSWKKRAYAVLVIILGAGVASVVGAHQSYALSEPAYPAIGAAAIAVLQAFFWTAAAELSPPILVRDTFANAKWDVPQAHKWAKLLAGERLNHPLVKDYVTDALTRLKKDPRFSQALETFTAQQHHLGEAKPA